MFHVPGSAVFFSRHCPVGLRCFFSPSRVPCSMFHVPGSAVFFSRIPACPVGLRGLRPCRRCPHRRSFPGGTARDSASGGTGGTWTRVSPNSGLPRWGSAVSSSRSRVPCSMFPVPLFSFPGYRLPATGYRLPATGLPRWGYFEIYYCTITTVLTMTYCWGWIAGIRQIFTRILLQIMPPVVQC